MKFLIEIGKIKNEKNFKIKNEYRAEPYHCVNIFNYLNIRILYLKIDKKQKKNQTNKTKRN